MQDEPVSPSWNVPRREDTPLASGLYVVATPIGNLEDISLRALRVLQQVDLVVAEDTRSAQHLLRAYGLQQPTLSLHRDNETQRIPRLLQTLAEGKRVALISEAGTPCISDPGELTVQAVVQAGFPVFPIPGPSAVITALSAAGLPSPHFIFLGFLPQRRAKRVAILHKYCQLPATLVLYASPHDILELLPEWIEVLGDRSACIGRELTKKFEEFLRGPLSVLLTELQQRDRMRGEFVVLIEGASSASQPVDLAESGGSTSVLSLQEQIRTQAQALLATEGKLTQLAQQLARQFPTLSRQQAYQMLQEIVDADQS